MKSNFALLLILIIALTFSPLPARVWAEGPPTPEPSSPLTWFLLARLKGVNLDRLWQIERASRFIQRFIWKGTDTFKVPWRDKLYDGISPMGLKPSVVCGGHQTIRIGPPTWNPIGMEILQYGSGITILAAVNTYELERDFSLDCGNYRWVEVTKLGLVPELREDWQQATDKTPSGLTLSWTPVRVGNSWVWVAVIVVAGVALYFVTGGGSILVFAAVL